MKCSYQYVIEYNNNIIMQKGTPGLLEIFRVAGGKFSRKQTWKSHVFKIQDGALTYYRQEMV